MTADSNQPTTPTPQASATQPSAKHAAPDLSPADGSQLGAPPPTPAPPTPAAPPSSGSGVVHGSYSLVAWPPSKLDGWLRGIQQELGVRAFGVPHINLRAPFQTELSSAELIDRFRDVLDGAGSFEVSVTGWKRYKSVIFLECEASARMLYLHMMALSVGPSTRSPFDGESYAPHLTLALGLLPWAEDEIWEQIKDLEPPKMSFKISALSLTIEEKGEFQELHTFPLVTPPAEEQHSGEAPSRKQKAEQP